MSLSFHGIAGLFISSYLWCTISVYFMRPRDETKPHIYILMVFLYVSVKELLQILFKNFVDL